MDEKSTVITWHKYPDENPKEDTWVLVAFEDNRIDVDHFYCGKFQWWQDEGETIVAWKELDKPYKKEASNNTEPSRKAFICPHYQGVCGLDEDIVCYCPNFYEMCNMYKEAK